MKKQTKDGTSAKQRPLFHTILFPLELVIALVFFIKQDYLGLLGSVIWTLLILVGYQCLPHSKLHQITLDKLKTDQMAITILVVFATILVCILPMGESPVWNGEILGHRNQYEVMAESILDGRLNLEYDNYDPSDLESLNNPYDPQERTEAGIVYKWDHAYYKGEYYMYFGIVPVFLLFLPYRVITGCALTTYHATQIFVAVSIIAIFCLFYLLSRLFFKKLPFGVYLAMSTVVSFMSNWYHATTPSLYCTAISAAVCLAIWSIYFFIKAVFSETDENKQMVLAFWGAVFGALTFGCRPPIALTNILVLPMLVVFLKSRKLTGKLLGKLLLAASPYFVVAALLMTYNYLRFENPFEFGQTYQLTVTDQTQYSSILDSFQWDRQLNGIFQNFFSLGSWKDTFPYISFGGVFFNFPILLLTFWLFDSKSIAGLRNKRFFGTATVLFATPIIITFIDVLWSPYLLERYRSDIYFLMGILLFLATGFRYNTVDIKSQKRYSATIMLLCIITCIHCVTLFCVPNDANMTSYYPERLDSLDNVMYFWKYLFK